MARYGKFFNDSDTEASDIMTTSDGGEYTDEVLRADGWLPVVEVGEPSDSSFRVFHYTKVDDEDGGHIEESYTIVRPPRTFSRYRLKLAIASRGLLQEFNYLLSSFEVLPGYPAIEAFNDALTLDEDNQGFKDAVALAKDRLHLTDEDVESILQESVAQ